MKTQNERALKIAQQRLERLRELRLFARNRLYKLEQDSKKIESLIKGLKEKITKEVEKELDSLEE